MMHVYLITNKPGGTLHISVTDDLVHRIAQHRAHQVKGFADRYNLDRLVWCECYETADLAIQRQKNIKKWPRAWKVALIEKSNPAWLDLWPQIDPKR